MNGRRKRRRGAALRPGPCRPAEGRSRRRRLAQAADPPERARAPRRRRRRTSRRPIGVRGRARRRATPSAVVSTIAHITCATARTRIPLAHDVERDRPEIDQRHHQARDDRQNAERAGQAEAGDDEDFDAEQDGARGEQRHFLPSGEADHHVAEEEQAEAHEARQQREAVAARVEFDQQAEKADGHQQRRDDRVGERARDALGPVHGRVLGRTTGDAELLLQFDERADLVRGDAVLDRLVGGQRQHLALLVDAFDLDVGIDHRLGDVRAPALGLGRRLHFLAHVGNDLLLDRLHALGGHTHLHRRRRADRAARRHRDHVCGER